jgi:hypothetical protein
MGHTPRLSPIYNIHMISKQRCAAAYCCGCPRRCAEAHAVSQQHDNIAAAAQQVEVKEPRLRHTPVLQYNS